ncbi:MAG: Gfo/Idh/MocA family oxidoreductase [Oscillospiraceae bacterium]|jgi:predicted dehydrogenase|nr:Gfo/Idh/MocA family oxidoreductase [Oscillospiraceae bacterium]
MSLKVGIVGYGGMGSFHHSQISSINEVMEVIACYDINPQKGKEGEGKGLKRYEQLDALLADKNIDIILIATPNNFHKDISIQALKAGKHVICEKPVTMNAKELEEIINVAEKQNSIFSVHQNRRWDRDFRIVKKAIENAIIGTPFYIESRVQGSRGVPGDWRCVKEAGGGMLYDWGIHLLDQMMWLVDSPVVEVYAHLLSVKFPEVDDNFKLMLRFKNGISALIEVDTYTFINLPRWHVSGDAGTLVINDWDCNGKIVKANTIEFKWEEGIVYTSAGPTKTMAPRPIETITEEELPQVQTDCRDYYRNFAGAVLGEQELKVTPLQALRVMQVIDAAFYSAENGVSVKGEF